MTTSRSSISPCDGERKAIRQSVDSPAQASDETKASVEEDGRALGEVAAEVRAIYVAFYKRFMARVQYRDCAWRSNARWDGGRYRGQDYEPIWPAVVDFIQSLKLPSFEFIRHRFTLCSRTPPPPDALLSDIGAEGLHEGIKIFREDLQWMLRQQVDVHRAICRGRLFDWYGNSGGNELWERSNDQRSRLFLYSMAVRDGHDDFIEHYRKDAFRQYLKCPYAYNVEWKAVLPESICRNALTYFGVVSS